MRIHILVLAVFVLGACTPRLIPYPEPSPAISAPGLPSTRVTPGPETDQVLALAVADLSSRLSIDPSLVQLSSIESANWSDSALGCPSPGEQYAQRTIPGYRLYLEAGGRRYEYHADAGSTAILCPEDQLPSFPVTPDDLDDGVPWMPVD